MTAGTTIFAADHYVVEFFSAPNGNGTVVITFAELGDQRLGETGFGGDFLLKNGFDVVAFKCSVNRWYNDAPPRMIEAADAFLSELPNPHRSRACYGASMGGYAALLFAKALQADVTFAICPQYDITAEWDTRWKSYIFGPMRVIAAHDIKPDCTYVILYDPRDADQLHVDKIASVIPASQLIVIPVPYSGHPPTRALLAAGQMKDIARLALSGSADEIRPRDISVALHHTPLYEFFLANRCLERRHKRWATALIMRALTKSPLDADINVKAAQLSEEEGDLTRAIIHLSTAIAIEPENPYLFSLLAMFLRRSGRPSAALRQLDIAISLRPEEPEFLRLRTELTA